MNEYTPPIERAMRALRTVGLDDLLELPAFAGIDAAAVRDVLDGFGRLAAEVIAPTDRIGDLQGATFDPATGKVRVPDELAGAFESFVKGGWTSLAAPERHGGGGFPNAVASVTQEFFASANLALSLNPVLTQSAIELLAQRGDERQQQLFLRRLLDGTWTGTMNLTEPDAGSDVGAVRTTAVDLGDGRWAISGTKIFITWGEHELAENIIHLVLARAPGGPAGTRGISLFLVPKVLVDDDGRLGARNAVRCLSIEHKLGINASPTCVLEFDRAAGELVGSVHGGMAAMFTMMNTARLAIGIEGVAIGERALQQSFTFAHERRQGASSTSTDGGSSPIVEHPDVQRMLLDMATTVDAGRLLTYATSIATDVSRHHPDAETRRLAQRRVDLLTPLAKAWPSDQGVRVASLGIQVHGGMGFVEETGIAQRYRDARIVPIYEGTNGIQAIDLVMRKVARDRGETMGLLLDEVEATIDAASSVDALAQAAASIAAALTSMRTATAWIVDRAGADPDEVLAGATAYLELAAVVTAGHLYVRQALAAVDAGTGDAGTGDAGREAARVTFFAAEHIDRACSLSRMHVGPTLAVGLGIDTPRLTPAGSK